MIQNIFLHENYMKCECVIIVYHQVISIYQKSYIMATTKISVNSFNPFQLSCVNSDIIFNLLKAISILVEEWWMEWWRCLICTRPEHLIAFYSARWGRHVIPLRHLILSWFWANQSLLLLLNAACLVEKKQITIWPHHIIRSRHVCKPIQLTEMESIEVNIHKKLRNLSI